MKCINFRIRTRNYEKQLYCVKKHKEIKFKHCNNCKYKDFKPVKELKKKSNKYYFSEKAQKSAWYRYGVTSIRTFVIVMVIALILACIIIFTEDNNTNNNLGELQNGVLADATNQNEFQNKISNYIHSKHIGIK